MDNPSKCPQCGSGNLVEVRDDIPPPHHGKLMCGDCGHFLKWLAGPVADFRMPFGKYRSRTLAEIGRDDRRYLEWLATEMANDKIRAKAREQLAAMEAI